MDELAKEAEEKKEEEKEKREEKKDSSESILKEQEEELIKALCTNEFLRLLMRINGKTNFDFMYTGFRHLLTNIIESRSASLPNSVREISFYQELVLILWRALTFNSVNIFVIALFKLSRILLLIFCSDRMF